MKVVVVNDCAHVLEDLIPYLSERFNIEFIQRSRGWFSKTLGVFWKILRAEGDLFHVNYALQDAYLVDRLKHHLDILHIHGSDIRWTIHSKRYGWIVKNNLKHAKKVLYATPDLERAVKKLRPDAIYLPTPVRTDIFKMKKHYNDPPRAIYFKCHYERLPENLKELLKDNNISLTVKERNIPYSLIPSVLSEFDIYIDRFTIPSFSKTCLEAMSCGLATIDYRHKTNLPERTAFLSDISNVKETGKQNRKFILEKHDAKKVAEMLAEIWEETQKLTR